MPKLLCQIYNTNEYTYLKTNTSWKHFIKQIITQRANAKNTRRIKFELSWTYFILYA